ncbi:FtsK/SpoIIIE domain-containing protein [Streptomyces sp. NBC_01500]|uniref:FtsK/SpoIIIE domain-containing protein n=1 Tax=Streptomyces sp. NBC_01500 TaxID=2903886 RepID=UPI002255B088|nr:FtsK/SpoIIIE domain-containing protein [Streptomyces sp. NBC_01500]MCX4549249.1 FtsK/SpoIIIE domain-containing protein [Streptomyces sp. NBC_01500]
MSDNVISLHKNAPGNDELGPPVLTIVPDPAPAAPVPLWVRSGRTIGRAVTHERTRAGARALARHSLYVAGGAGVVARRTWQGRTVAVHHQMRAAAVAAGNHELAAEWQEKADRFRTDRHRRRMELIAGVPQMARSAAIGAAGTEGALLLLGACMAVHDHHLHDVIAPTLAAVDAVRALCWFIGVAWGPALALVLMVALSHLWRSGQQQQTAPAWARPATGATDDVPVTPSVVVKALSDLGISSLRKAVKDMADGAAGMLGPITLAGCGVEVDVTLPSGVSTEEVLGKRRKLAENLNRHEHELHMTIPPAARTVRMWIADSGALDQPIGPSPLVTDPDTTADMHRGRAPWGVDLRGDAVLVSLWQKHMLITGLSNQGKTASLRALALWLALDPRVEFHIADLKGVGDWQMFDGIATVLIQGPTDDHVVQATEMLEEAVAEMAARIALMRELTAKGWSQDKILADPRFNPLILLIDEAQVAYGSGARETFTTDKGTVRYGAPYGGSKADSRYFQAVKKIHDQGRAVNVTTWEGTQDPTNENLPKRSREGNHIRASLVLGTESQARMAVGDSAVDAGAAPHKLRQGLDKGTLVVAGDGIKLAPGQPSVTARTHYIGPEDAETIAERAKALRAGVKTSTGTQSAPREADHLADVAAVLGTEERMKSDEVRQHLAHRWPEVYQKWSASDLVQALKPFGAEPRKYNGNQNISRARLLAAIETRADETEDTEDAG